MKPLIPNEHGAWGMLATSFLLGWLGAPVLSWKPLLLVPAALGAFMARYPLGLYFKKRRVTRAMQIPLTREKIWFTIFASFTALTGLPLLYPLGWWWLLVYAGIAGAALALHLVSVMRRKERTFWVEWTAMFGIATLGPAASSAASPQWGWQPFTIWGALLAYYTWRIRVVRGLVASQTTHPVDIRRVGTRELTYSLVFLATTVLILRVAALFL